jgi:hypothetical protein
MMPKKTTGQSDISAPTLLRTYLNDHLGGATAGVELARRIALQHHDAPSGPALRRLARDVAQDRVALVRIMHTLGIRVNRVKLITAWAVEKAARIKPNNTVLRRSPLSDVLEFEAMLLGVEGKACGWRTLRAIAHKDLRVNRQEIENLEARAQRQLDHLEGLRQEAATAVGAGPRP